MIYILHGWTYETQKWGGVVSFLKNNKHEVEILKLPGLTEKLEVSWTIEDYVEWLNTKISKDKEIIIIGHSNGGRIALAYETKYPNKISKLILIDSAGVYHNELSIKVKRFFFKYVAKIGKFFTNSSVLKKALYKLAGESDYNQASDIMKKTMQNLISYDPSDKLIKITTLTLIIWGENDKTTPLSDGLLFKKLLRNSKLHIIRGAGHSPQYTNVDEVSTIIRKFIE